MIIFLKAHIAGYTRTDGTVVAPHEDKRPRKTLYHGSSEHVTEIKDKGLFGGLFASQSKDSANSHGEVVHKIDLPEDEIMTQSQLEDVSDDDLKAAASWVDDDDLERLRELVVDDEQADDDDARIMRTDDAGEASWEAQRIRGVLAKRAGFKAVEMNDEHGTSYLVLPGVKIKRHEDGEMTKSHPVTQAMSGGAKPIDLVDGETRRNPGEPSPEQAEADTYKKPRIQWRGLTIAIENPAGSVRRGTNRHGVSWEIRMRFDYGEVLGSMGVDGDPVDIYMGPNLEAHMVYVVHQRKVGRWDEYDEDKCMVGFDCQSDAEAAFLSNYNDPRFLGPITAMPVDEFVAKVRATRDKPAMIKAHGPVVLFFKAHVGAYLRAGKLVNVTGYQGRSAHAVAGPGQMSLFGGPESGKPLPPSPLQGKDAVAHTPDMFAGGKTSIEQFKDLARTNPAFVRDTLDQRLRTAGDDYEIREVPHADIQPLQTGADYLNDSSRETARRIRAGDVRRNEDLLPIRLSHDGKILDGHHRHAAAGLNGEKTMLAMVPVGTGRGRIRNINDFAKEPQHTGPTRDMVAEHGEHDHLLTGITGAKFARGKGRIAGHYGVDVGGEMMSNYHADPVHAVAEAKQWMENRADNERNKAARSAAVGNMRDRLMTGGDVTDSDLKLLGLKDGSSGLKWFTPAAAEVFGITSHAVRPHIKSVIRTGTTDMGTKLEFVDPKKALQAVAAGLAPNPVAVHPAPTPRGMLGLIPEDRRTEWLDRYRQQHEMHHYELGQVREKMARTKSKINALETGLREAEHGLKMQRSAPFPDTERERAYSEHADSARSDFDKHSKEYEKLVGQHQSLYERVSKMGREQERIYGGSGDMDMDTASMRKRDPEAQRQHEKSMLKMYRDHYKTKPR